MTVQKLVSQKSTGGSILMAVAKMETMVSMQPPDRVKRPLPSSHQMISTLLRQSITTGHRRRQGRTWNHHPWNNGKIIMKIVPCTYQYQTHPPFTNDKMSKLTVVQRFIASHIPLPSSLAHVYYMIHIYYQATTVLYWNLINKESDVHICKSFVKIDLGFLQNFANVFIACFWSYSLQCNEILQSIQNALHIRYAILCLSAACAHSAGNNVRDLLLVKESKHIFIHAVVTDR